MPLRYLQPIESQYVPRHTPVAELNPNLVNNVMGQVAQQGMMQEQRWDLQSQVMGESLNNLQGLTPEQQNEARNVFLQADTDMRDYFDTHGSRDAGRMISSVARRTAENLRPYQQRSAEILSIQERIKNSEADSNVKNSVFNLLANKRNLDLTQTINLERQLNILDNWKDPRERIIELEKMMQDGTLSIGIGGVGQTQDGQIVEGLIKSEGRTPEQVSAMFNSYLLGDKQIRDQFLLELELSSPEEYAQFRNENGEIDFGAKVTLRDGRTMGILDYKAAQITEPAALARGAVKTSVSNLGSLTGGRKTVFDEHDIYTNQRYPVGIAEGESGYKNFTSWFNSKADEINEIQSTKEQISQILSSQLNAISGYEGELTQNVDENSGAISFTIPNLPNHVDETTRTSINNTLDLLNSQARAVNNLRREKVALQTEVESHVANSLGYDLNSFGITLEMDSKGNFNVSGDADSLVKAAFKTMGTEISHFKTLKPEDVSYETHPHLYTVTAGSAGQRRRSLNLDRLNRENAQAIQAQEVLTSAMREGRLNELVKENRIQRSAPGQFFANLFTINDTYYYADGNKVYQLHGASSLRQTGSILSGTMGRTSSTRITDESVAQWATNQFQGKFKNELDSIIQTRTAIPAKEAFMIPLNTTNVEAKNLISTMLEPSFLQNMGMTLDNKGDTIDMSKIDPRSLSFLGVIPFSETGDPIAIIGALNEKGEAITFQHTNRGLTEFVNRTLPNDILHKEVREDMLSYVAKSDDIGRIKSSYTFPMEYIKSLAITGANPNLINSLSGVTLTRQVMPNNNSLFTFTLEDKDGKPIKTIMNQDYVTAFEAMLTSFLTQ
jgi:hypothetical protein